MRKFAIFCTRKIHFAVILFVMFGWLSTQNGVLLTHLVFCPLLLIHWATNDDRCYLTELEYKLEKKPLPTVESGQKKAENTFLGSFIKNSLKIEISYKHLGYLNRGTIILVSCISFFKIYKA